MSVAPFVPSPAEVIRKMLDMVQPVQGEILYDLGCGDGRIVVMAARD
jgi:phospholipid N-methyltransferase